MKLEIAIYSIVLILLLIFLVRGCKCEQEGFVNEEPTEGNPFGCTLGMNRYKYVKDGECCDVWPVGDIVPASCNRVPLFPEGMEPIRDIPDSVKIPEAPFEQLVPKTGKFTFVIPELRYDGIWTQRGDPSDPSKCCWTLNPKSELKTYGGDHLSPTPEKSLYGKTVIEPPECAGLWPVSNPPVTLVYDCHEDVPCSVRMNLPCPTRV